MDDKARKELRDEIFGWYWGKNAQSPAVAYAMMLDFIDRAKRRACMENGAMLKRGQYRFVAREILDEYHISQQSFRNICNKISNMKIAEFQHQKNKKATIVTICNFNSYEPTNRKGNTISNTKTNKVQHELQQEEQHESHMNATNNICTHDNNINNKNFNNNKFQSSTAGTAGARPRARAGADTEKPPIFAYVNDLANDAEWISAVARMYSISTVSVTIWLSNFREYCLAGKKDQKLKDISDCASYFRDWLKYQLKARQDKIPSRKTPADSCHQSNILVSTHEEDEKHREKIRNWIATQTG